MTKQVLSATLMIALIYFAPPIFSATPTASAPSEVAVDAVLKEVQLALATVQTQLADKSFPPLESVELTLETVLSKKGGGKFKLFIFSFGKTWEKERSQKLVLSLTPPKPYTAKDVA